MDPSALHRLREWLQRPEIASLDPRRIEALALSLTEPDPPVRVERWGTVVGYEAGPPRRRLVPFDRHRHLMTACRWSPYGALDWARCRAADGRWIGVGPRGLAPPPSAPPAPPPPRRGRSRGPCRPERAARC